MSERWVTDASPLITLAKVGESRLLTELCDDLLIPDAVRREILAGPPDDPARNLLDAGFGTPLSPQQIPPRLMAWGLGSGETEVLALALQKGALCVLDDAAARRCALTLGIPMVGTLGIILRAKRESYIESAAPLLRSLQEAGFRIAEDTVRTVLRSVDEAW